LVNQVVFEKDANGNTNTEKQYPVVRDESNKLMVLVDVQTDKGQDSVVIVNVANNYSNPVVLDYTEQINPEKIGLLKVGDTMTIGEGNIATTYVLHYDPTTDRLTLDVQVLPAAEEATLLSREVSQANITWIRAKDFITKEIIKKLILFFGGKLPS